jgi:acyl-CoA thioester hydrolase
VGVPAGAGLTYDVLTRAGLGPVNLEANVRFLHELRDGDEIAVTCEFGWGDGKTYHVRQQFSRTSDGTLAAEVTTVSGVISQAERRLVTDPAGRLRALATAPQVMGL